MRSLFRSLFPFGDLEPPERRLLTLMWLIGVFQGMAQAPLSAILPFTRVGLGLSEGQMSFVLAVTRVASLGAVVFSVWGDRGGRRKPFLAAMAVMLVGSGLTAVSPNATWFTVSQSLVRIATTAVGTLGVVLVAERMRSSYRAFAIGLYAAAASLGAGFGQLMLPVAATGDQAWRYAFFAPVLSIAFVPFVLRVQESPLMMESGPRIRFRSLLVGRESKDFWLSGIAGLCAAAFPAVALAFTNERLVNDLGYSAGAATAIALSGGTIGALGFWLGGRLADTVGRRITTVVSLAASVLGGLALFQVETVPALLAAIVVGGFGSFSYVPAASSHRAELFPTRIRATAGSGSAYLATVGSALGLGFGAGAIDVIGLFQTLRWLSILMAVAAILTWMLPETRGKDLAP
ncbi:MAG: MFS transporter [Acidimicrobiia bacterium]|nr:MFS transporter [Acidimicrobiia bacterium]MDH4309179.1 MFS transporter [Acidimicrobiia bacterium]